MNKKGQEEMVGFVVIVLIIAIIFLVVLGIVFWQKNGSEVKSVDVLQFLESTLETTTSCALEFEPAYSSVGDLLISCYSEPNKECKPSKENVCKELNKTLEEILDVSWKVGGNYSLKGYEFEAIHQERSGSGTKFLEFKKGECNGSYVGDEYLLPSKQTRGTILVKLKIFS